MADLGFPRGGGANSRGGRQHTILPKFPKNCMKLKEFGRCPKFYYVDPPLQWVPQISPDDLLVSKGLQEVNCDP